MLNPFVPFLTDIDSRAAIKGSRDPLGVQAVWSRLGRQIVGNLTTVSASVREFVATTLGFYFAELAGQERADSDGDLATFLKWEQLAAYARAVVNDDRRMRGTERVWARMAEDSIVPLGTGSHAQILSNQKTYGLWGLYVVPSKASGILEGEPRRLTPAAREHVERRLLPVLEKSLPRAIGAVLDRLRGNEYRLDLRARSRDRALLEAVARVFKATRAAEKPFYREHLLFGGPHDRDPQEGTLGRQRVLAELLEDSLGDKDWALSPITLLTLAGRASKQGEVGEALCESLRKIRTAELLLAPASALFDYVLECDGQPFADVVNDVRRQWGAAPKLTIDRDATAQLQHDLHAAGDVEGAGPRWVGIATALHDGAYDDAVRLLLTQNREVMKARAASSAWADIRDGKMKVEYRGESLATLPESDELASFWRHPYFIPSLRAIAMDLRE